MATCDFCNKTYTRRGLSRHLKACKAKAKADKDPPEVVLIINGDVTSYVIQYLSLGDLVVLNDVVDVSKEIERRASLNMWPKTAIKGINTPKDWIPFLKEQVVPYLCKRCDG